MGIPSPRRGMAPTRMVEVDPGNPFASMLEMVLVPHVGEIVSGRGFATVPNASTAPILTRWGTAWSEASASSHWSFISRGMTSRGVRVPTSYMCVFRKGTGTGGTAAVMNVQCNLATTSEQTGFTLGWGGTFIGNNGTNLIIIENTIAQRVSSYALADGDHVVVVTTDGATLRAYVDGAEAYSVSTTGGANSDGVSVVLGAQLSNGTTRRIGSTEGIVAGAVWRRAMTAADAASLYADPFQMLRG